VLGSYLAVGDFLSAPESIFNAGEFPSAWGHGVGRGQTTGRDLIRRRVLLRGWRRGGSFALVARGHLILRDRKPEATDQHGRDHQEFRHYNLIDMLRPNGKTPPWLRPPAIYHIKGHARHDARLKPGRRRGTKVLLKAFRGAVSALKLGGIHAPSWTGIG
jgi:hypothetical protein